MATATLIALDVEKSVGTGDASSVAHLLGPKAVQVAGVSAGTFVLSTVKVQGSIDGVSWSDLTPEISSDCIMQITAPVCWLRVETTAYSSGTPTVTVRGYADGWQT